MKTLLKTKPHPYIEFNEKICAGKPIIMGTRTTVRSIVEVYKRIMSIEEILQIMPHLTPAQIHDALSYYYDHQQDIENDILQNLEKNCMKQYPAGKF